MIETLTLNKRHHGNFYISRTVYGNAKVAEKHKNPSLGSTKFWNIRSEIEDCYFQEEEEEEEKESRVKVYAII